MDFYNKLMLLLLFVSAGVRNGEKVATSGSSEEKTSVVLPSKLHLQCWDDYVGPKLGTMVSTIFYEVAKSLRFSHCVTVHVLFMYIIIIVTQ